MKRSKTVKESECPICHAAMGMATPVDGGSDAPKPGDITICLYCTTSLVWTEDMGLRLLEANEFESLDAFTKDQLMSARAMIDKQRQVEYCVQMDQMLANREAWTKANPNREAKVQFNVPPRVAAILSISKAMELGFVSTNEAGAELIKALWPMDVQSEATLNMVQAVLEEGT